MPTPNLNIAEVAQNQNQKEVTINEALASLDEATQGLLALSINEDTTLTAAQFRSRFAFQIGGTVTEGIALTIPGNINRLFSVINTLAFPVTVTLGASTSIVAAGTYQLLYTDGTNLYSVSGGSSGTPAPARLMQHFATLNLTNINGQSISTPDPAWTLIGSPSGISVGTREASGATQTLNRIGFTPLASPAAATGIKCVTKVNGVVTARSSLPLTPGAFSDFDAFAETAYHSLPIDSTRAMQWNYQVVNAGELTTMGIAANHYYVLGPTPYTDSGALTATIAIELYWV